jgi:hypothetical protein
VTTLHEIYFSITVSIVFESIHLYLNFYVVLLFTKLSY